MLCRARFAPGLEPVFRHSTLVRLTCMDQTVRYSRAAGVAVEQGDTLVAATARFASVGMNIQYRSCSQQAAAQMNLSAGMTNLSAARPSEMSLSPHILRVGHSLERTEVAAGMRAAGIGFGHAAGSLFD